MVFDDTFVAKTGKLIEKVSRVWDHVLNSRQLGFTLLLKGYWDGVSFIPLDFSYLREKGKNKGNPFGLKKKELKKHAVHLIGMYKIAKTKFMYSGGVYTYSQIRNMLGKARRCRKLGFYYKEATVSHGGKELKLFFSRQGTNGNWKVFICTDTRLSFIKMVEIYQIRWSIEVFFKEAKQLLGLGKCQSNDFDAQIADATITMVQHILLTCKFRYENYESKTGIFAQIKEETTLQRLDQRLWGLFLEIVKIIEEIFERTLQTYTCNVG